MKKNLRIVTGTIAASVLFLMTVNTLANEEYVIIPNKDFHEQISYDYGEKLDEEGLSILNRFGSVPKSIFKTDESDPYKTVDFYYSTKNSSLEGLQYLEAESLNLSAALIDVTPLSNFKKLKSLNVRDNPSDNQNLRTGLRDLKFLENFSTLESFNYGNNMNFEENAIPLLDFSGLDNHPNLKSLTIETGGNLDPVYLTKNNRKYTTTLPLVFPKFFDFKQHNNITSPGMEEIAMNEWTQDTKLTWNDIEYGTEYLTVYIQIQPNGLYYIAQIHIPIIWVD